MAEIPGFAFMLLTFFLVLLFPRARANNKLLLACWGTLFFRHSLAMKDAFVGAIIPAMGDNVTFHYKAAYHDMFPAQGEPYIQLLSAVYDFFGASRFLGNECSVLAYVVSLYFLLEMIEIFKIEQYSISIVLMFGLSPSAAVHCSITLRESYQVLSFLMTLWALYKIRLEPKPLYFGMLLVSLIMFTRLHNGLAIFALASGAIGLIWALRSRIQLLAPFIVCLALITPLIIGPLLSALAPKSKVIQHLESGDLTDYAETYRDNVELARSDYGATLDFSSPLGIVTSFPPVLFLYEFAPMPWSVSSPVDLYSLAESLLRLALIWGAWKQYKSGTATYRDKANLTIVLTFLLEALWATGTRNWGTATRHHLVGYAAYLLLGTPYWLSIGLNSDLKNLRLRRSRSLARIVGPILNQRKTISQPARSLGEALRPYRENSGVFFLVLLLSISSLIFVSRHAFEGLAWGRTVDGFISESLVFVQPTDRGSFRRALGDISPVDMWLSSPQGLEELIKHKGIVKKAFELMPVKEPGESAELFQGHIKILPLARRRRFTGDDILAFALQAQVNPDAQRDADSSNVQDDRIVLIRILAHGDSPQIAQRRALATTQALQETLENLATEKAARTREALVSVVLKAEENLSRVQSTLAQTQKQVSTKNEEQVLKERMVLEDDVWRLGEELVYWKSINTSISSFLNREGTAPPVELLNKFGGLDDRLSILQKEEAMAGRIYQPDFPGFQQIHRDRVEFEAFRDQERDRLARSLLKQVENQISGRERARSQMVEELATMKGPLHLAERAQLEKQADTMEVQLLEWGKQFFQLRLEERLGAADGSSMVLLNPQPGVQPQMTLAAFVEKFPTRIFLMLPACCFIAFLTTGLAAEVRKSSRQRVEQYFNLPIVAALPVLPRRRVLVWQSIKNEGFGRTSKKKKQ